MKTAIRTAAAIVLGMLTAIVLIVAVEMIGAIVHPPPPGFDSSSPEQMHEYVIGIPQWFLAVAVVLAALTVTGVRGDEPLMNEPEVLLYTAWSECPPTLRVLRVNVATPPFSICVPRSALPSINVTEPSGVPLPGDTAATETV